MAEGERGNIQGRPADRPVTLQDLASALGISRSAASKAMRDHPEISIATRQRVQSLARELGYVRDPALTRLARLRWNKQAPGSGESVAYVFPPETPPDRPQIIVPTLEKVFVSEGFNFQTVHARDYSPSQLCSILKARGVRGIILHNVWDAALPQCLCDDGFACVAVAEGPVVPSCELIRQDFIWCMNDAIRRHFDEGYRRLAYIFREKNHESELFSTLQAIWLNAGLQRTKILLHDLEDHQSLFEQLKRTKPEAIIHHDYVRLPRDVWRSIGGHGPNREIVLRLIEGERGRVAGYYLSDERLAKRAAQYLAGRLKQAGPDTLYGKILLRPEWVTHKGRLASPGE